MTHEDPIHPANPSSYSYSAQGYPPASGPQGQPRKRLGEFLVEAGFVTPSHVEVALLDQGVTGHRIGEIMVLRGWVDQPTVETMVKLQSEGGSPTKAAPAEVVRPHPPESPNRQVILGSVEQQDADTVAMNIDDLMREMAEEEARSAQNLP